MVVQVTVVRIHVPTGWADHTGESNRSGSAGGEWNRSGSADAEAPHRAHASASLMGRRKSTTM